MLRNIEAERSRRNITKKDLCKCLGITPKTYWNWISGKTPIPHTKLLILSERLGVSIEYLLGVTETASGA